MEIIEIESKTKTLKEDLGDLEAMHTQLSGSLDAQKAQLEETRAMLRDKQAELEDNVLRYKDSKDKLARVSNTREYNALEKEMETLKRIQAQLEEEQEQLREAVEGSEEDVAEKQSKTTDLEAEMKRQRSAITRGQKAAAGQIESHTAEREKLKKDFAAQKAIIRRYEFIRSKRDGRVIVAVNGGVCSGCNMMVPPQLYNEIMVGQKIHQCPTCQRILFYEPEEVVEDE